jgi:hypothetical protein
VVAHLAVLADLTSIYWSNTGQTLVKIPGVAVVVDEAHLVPHVPRIHIPGQTPVKHWPNTVKRRSNTGQTLVNHWSNTGQTHQPASSLVKRRSNTGAP